MMRIVFTGGGTAGHVTPNIALIHAMRDQGIEFHYIGSGSGIEHELITLEQIPFHSIVSGKLRRELTLKNLMTPFSVLKGIFQSLWILRKLKPTVVFSKGGYVAFPVVFAAWCLGIPVVAHESDFSPGLANKMSFPFVKKVCVTFEKGKDFFKAQDKVLVTGTPLRKALFQGDPKKAEALCDFQMHKPVLLLIGGSQGSRFLNDALRGALNDIVKEFNVIHLCGNGAIDESLGSVSGYKQFEYLHDELADCLALADVVISRAGANTLYELLYLKKVSLLVPLSRKVSRGEQLENAKYFSERGYAAAVEEESLTSARLYQEVISLFEKKTQYQDKIEKASLGDANQTISELLLSFG